MSLPAKGLEAPPLTTSRTTPRLGARPEDGRKALLVPLKIEPSARRSNVKAFASYNVIGNATVLAFVLNVNLSGSVSGLPAASASVLPLTSVMAGVSSVVTTAPNGNACAGAKRAI